MSNEVFDVCGYVIGVGALWGRRVVGRVGWGGCGPGVSVGSAGGSAVQGQGGMLLSVG